MKWLLLRGSVCGGGYAGWNHAMRVRPIEGATVGVTERAAGTPAAVLNASGYVTARRKATVSSKITGKVVEVNVEEGMAIQPVSLHGEEDCVGTDLAAFDDHRLGDDARAADALADDHAGWPRELQRPHEQPPGARAGKDRTGRHRGS